MLFVVSFFGMSPTRGQKLQSVQAPRPHIIHLLSTPRRRFVTRADLRKFGVTVVCSACSDTVVHGKTSKLHTVECRNRIGEQLEHDPEGHERLKFHKRRRDVEPEIEANRAPIGSENEGDPVLQEQREVEMPVEASVEFASVKRGSDAAADDEERARLRVRAEGKRGQEHERQDALEPQVKTRARLEPRRGRRAKAPDLFQIWRKRSRRQFLLRVALLHFREARARVLRFLSILLWPQA